MRRINFLLSLLLKESTEYLKKSIPFEIQSIPFKIEALLQYIGQALYREWTVGHSGEACVSAHVVLDFLVKRKNAELASFSQ